MPTTYRSRFDEIARELNPRVDLAVRKTAKRIARDASANLARGAGIVHLQDRIHVERVGMAEYEVRAGDDEAWYGHLVEFGTQAHTISNALGRGIEVEHPGGSPKPFLIPAAEFHRKTLDDEVADALRDL